MGTCVVVYGSPCDTFRLWVQCAIEKNQYLYLQAAEPGTQWGRRDRA